MAGTTHAAEQNSHNGEIVSCESDELILVDAQDNEIGVLEKSACHDGDGVLHRAFSAFIFNRQGQLLLQQRGASKRLWPKFWSNSCCSHPRVGETMEQAVARRLGQELGLTADLDYLYRFQYQARYSAAGSENELCSVFLGATDAEPTINVTEIEASQWLSVADLEAQLQDCPEKFPPWFKMEWQSLRTNYSARLAALTDPGC
jgi:isopentenyl-diphosphate delta-isomerase